MKKLGLIGVLTTLVLTACSGNGDGNYYWSKQADADLRYAVGDYIKDIPVFTEGTLAKSRRDVDAETNIKFSTVYLIPEVVGDGYQYSSSFNYEMLDENTLYKALRIVVYNAYVDVEEEYFNNLKNKNFVIYNDFELDDENAKPVKTYPGYTGGAYDDYYYNKRSGELICGTYFTYGALNGAFIIDIFTFEAL